MQYCLANPFFDKQNLFCMCQCKAFAQMVDIWNFAAHCLNKEKGFLILCSSLIWNSFLCSGGKFGIFVLTFCVAGIQTQGYNTYMLRWSYKTIWIHFNLILRSLLKTINCRYCANFHFRGIKQELRYQILVLVFLSKHPCQQYE